MKILQIAYYYPPMGGAGVQRALKFSKYLPEFGVQPVVLAAHDPDYIHDETLTLEVPGSVPVHRVEHRPLLQRALAWRQARNGRLAPSAGAVPAGNAGLRDAVLTAWAALQFPDDKAGWARRAWPLARQLIRDEGVALIYSSAPPMSAHALAARLARESGLPWVADFRDLWLDNPGYRAPAWRRAIDQRTQAAWLRQAAGVVTVTPRWQRWLAARTQAEVAFIPNGYDEADFAAAARAAPAMPSATRNDGRFTLVHTGTFYGPRDPEALLRGVSLYLQSAAAQPIALRLIGTMGARFASRLAQFNVRHPGVIEQRPYLPHREALAEVLAADALLLVVGGPTDGAADDPRASSLPAKLFEYLRAAKPMLVIGHEQGDAATLVRQYGRGWIVDGTDPARIAAALQALVLTREIPGTAGSSPEVFERRHTAQQLAEFLLRKQAGR